MARSVYFDGLSKFRRSDSKLRPLGARLNFFSVAILAQGVPVRFPSRVRPASCLPAHGLWWCSGERRQYGLPGGAGAVAGACSVPSTSTSPAVARLGV